MGECGEYELLFTINKKKEREFLDESRLNQIHFTKIGEVTRKDIMLIVSNKKEFDFNDFNIHARNFERVSDYIKELMMYLKKANA